MSFGFELFEKFFFIFFFFMFALILGMFVYTIVRVLAEKRKNDRSPRLTVPATVAAKRTKVSTSHRHHGAHSGIHTSSSTWYYAAFEVESGDRMELRVPGAEYGLLSEGDRGKLTFQGTRYLSFERE